MFAERLIDWARLHLPRGYRLDDDFSRLLGVNVKDEKVVTDKVTRSRFNPEVVKVVSNMLSIMFQKTPYPLEDHHYNFLQRPKGSLLKIDQWRSGDDWSTVRSATPSGNH